MKKNIMFIILASLVLIVFVSSIVFANSSVEIQRDEIAKSFISDIESGKIDAKCICTKLRPRMCLTAVLDILKKKFPNIEYLGLTADAAKNVPVNLDKFDVEQLALSRDYYSKQYVNYLKEYNRQQNNYIDVFLKHLKAESELKKYMPGSDDYNILFNQMMFWKSAKDNINKKLGVLLKRLDELEPHVHYKKQRICGNIEECKGIKPKPGDIVFFSVSATNSHIAIVGNSDANGNVNLYDQFGSDCNLHKLKLKNGYYKHSGTYAISAIYRLRYDLL
ncbi:MAG: hypothetical protein V1870_00780 [Candidatus Aenigmatarchaeota archaeon]